MQIHYYGNLSDLDIVVIGAMGSTIHLQNMFSLALEFQTFIPHGVVMQELGKEDLIIFLWKGK
jgi:hypothetical protein